MRASAILQPLILTALGMTQVSAQATLDPNLSTSAPEAHASEHSNEANNQWDDIGISPGRWNSVVPENAMGFVMAIYPDPPGIFITLACGPSIPGLGMGVETPAFVASNSNFGPEDDVYFRLAGEAFRVRYHEDKASGGDPMHLMKRWDGQERLLQLLNSGADVEVVVYPNGKEAGAEVVATVAGSANDSGFAHVVAVCGDGHRNR